MFLENITQFICLFEVHFIKVVHFQTPTYQVVFASLVLCLKNFQTQHQTSKEINNLKNKESSL